MADENFYRSGDNVRKIDSRDLNFARCLRLETEQDIGAVTERLQQPPQVTEEQIPSNENCRPAFNATGSNILPCDVVGISKTYALQPDTSFSAQKIKQQPLLSAEEYDEEEHGCNFGVVTSGGGPGCTLRVCICGLFEAIVEIEDEEHCYAKPQAGSQNLISTEKPDCVRIMSRTETINGKAIATMKFRERPCECGEPGSMLEGTVVGTVEPGEEGDIEVEVNGSTQTKKFLNDCDPPEDDEEPATLEDGDQIEVFINNCCELVYLNCGKPGECDDCPDIIWCCCGECDTSAGSGGKELIEATAESCTKLGGTNLGLKDDVPEAEAKALCDAECPTCDDGEPKVCCNPSTGACEEGVCEEDCNGRSFDTLAECQECCCECDCSGIPDNQDLLNQSLSASVSGGGPNSPPAAADSDSPQQGTFVLCPGEIEGAKATFDLEGSGDISLGGVNFTDSGSASVSLQVAGIAVTSASAGSSGTNTPQGNFVGIGSNASHDAFTGNANDVSDPDSAAPLPFVGLPAGYTFTGEYKAKMKVEIEYFTETPAGFKCSCSNNGSVWGKITVTHSASAEGTATPNAGGAAIDVSSDVPETTYTIPKWFMFQNTCRFVIPSGQIRAGYSGFEISNANASANGSLTIEFPNDSGAAPCSQPLIAISKTQYTVGVGTKLTNILAEYGAPPCQRCKITAAKMDRMTVEQVEENFDGFVKEIYANIHKLPFWQKAKTAATALRHGLTVEALLRRAIEESKEQ